MFLCLEWPALGLASMMFAKAKSAPTQTPNKRLILDTWCSGLLWNQSAQMSVRGQEKESMRFRSEHKAYILGTAAHASLVQL